MKNYSTPIAVILAGIIIAGALYFNDGEQVKINESEINKQKIAVNINNVKIDGEPFIGDPNAPIAIAVWSDYQCSACKMNEELFISPLIKDYVTAGKVKIIFKDLVIFGDDSLNIALTAKAIWEKYPNKYYEWHKMIFDNQGSTKDWANATNINTLTKKISGIDTAVIEQLLIENRGKYESLINDNIKEAINFKINATPSFVIADQLIIGVPQYEEFKEYIESLLN